MSPAAQRRALASLEGYVWYRQRGTNLIDWGGIWFCLPPEDGIANPALKGTVSETRYCTPEEIEVALRSEGMGYYSYAPNYLEDRNAIVALLIRVHHPRFDYREEGNVWSILASLSGAEDAECLDKAVQRVALAAPALWAEAILRATGKWDDSL